MEENTKNWADYDQKHERTIKNIFSFMSQKSLLVYIIKNWNCADCSFLIKTAENKYLKRLYSFKWILEEISPTLKKTFSRYSEKICKDIPIDDPNFETILRYAHTKILNNNFEQLISLYESAYNFQIEPLMSEIIGMLQENINKTKNFTEWINLFKLTNIYKKNDPRMYNLFNKIIPLMSIEDLEKGLEMNLKMIATFDVDLFYDFLFILKTKGVSPLICVKAVYTYLDENIKPENKKQVKQVLESLNIGRDIMALLLQKIDFSKMSFEDVQRNLENSEWGDKIKKPTLKAIDNQH